jgi:hypothetical protein
MKFPFAARKTLLSEFCLLMWTDVNAVGLKTVATAYPCCTVGYLFPRTHAQVLVTVLQGKFLSGRDLAGGGDALL